ncbi:MAG TPA: PA domain-containing protein [Thermoanaerobaculia bacterium]|nr:PA domain-containing protein [Thermoanaerobaculia bacterium]
MKISGKLLPLLLPAILLASSLPASGAANIIIVNVNAPGVGFNDPTPATPVGGNPGTTVGQQRLKAFQFAASLWGSILDSPVPIYVQASFVPQTCTSTFAMTGVAQALQVFSDFPGHEVDHTFYHVALANKLAGADLAPGPNGTDADDILATFNSDLGTPNCPGTVGWYYGLDDNHGNRTDLVTVLLHELAHGLGFQSFVNKTTGANLAGMPDIFDVYTLDDLTGKHFPQMTDAERAAAITHTNHLVWDGLHVTLTAPGFLQRSTTPLLTVLTPLNLIGTYRVGPSDFGPPLTSPGRISAVVRALDPADTAGASTFDACSPLTNASAVNGKIALVDRGSCAFVVKVKNAQNAGATGVLIADNTGVSPPLRPGGTDPTIVIPSVLISTRDANDLKAALANNSPVVVSLGINPLVRDGASLFGLMELNAPAPSNSLASLSHWDPIAAPNLLMEPLINSDLTHDVDLTRQVMADIGWFSDGDGVPDGRDFCLGSSRDATVILGTCNSGVPNTTFASGCRISDAVSDCQASPGNHGSFKDCIQDLTKDLKSNGVISGKQKDAIDRCAGSY